MNFINVHILDVTKWDDVDESIKQLCKRTLHTLNAFGVEHNDHRIRNFIVDEGNGTTERPTALHYRFGSRFGFSLIGFKRLKIEELLKEDKSKETSVMNFGRTLE